MAGGSGSRGLSIGSEARGVAHFESLAERAVRGPSALELLVRQSGIVRPDIEVNPALIEEGPTLSGPLAALLQEEQDTTVGSGWIDPLEALTRATQQTYPLVSGTFWGDPLSGADMRSKQVPLTSLISVGGRVLTAAANVLLPGAGVDALANGFTMMVASSGGDENQGASGIEKKLFEPQAGPSFLPLPTTAAEVIGRKINELRRKARLTRQQLAEKLGITVSSVPALEVGRTWQDKYFSKLERIFGLDQGFFKRLKEELRARGDVVFKLKLAVDPVRIAIGKEIKRFRLDVKMTRPGLAASLIKFGITTTGPTIRFIEEGITTAESMYSGIEQVFGLREGYFREVEVMSSPLAARMYVLAMRANSMLQVAHTNLFVPSIDLFSLIKAQIPGEVINVVPKSGGNVFLVYTKDGTVYEVTVELKVATKFTSE